ncbi:hypothetical protein ROZALSC1DRAFT_11206 [Rozella allomycis CSF55]|nr:hypothetical protein ROZALSC1DRAFT_11206 [Rozella allomycis CSF55]
MEMPETAIEMSSAATSLNELNRNSNVPGSLLAQRSLRRKLTRHDQPPTLTKLPKSQTYPERKRQDMKDAITPHPSIKPVDSINETTFAGSCWRFFSLMVTFWAPSFILSSFGMKDPQVRQAWREKMASCFIILLVSALLAFLSFGFSQLVCVPYPKISTSQFQGMTATIIRGNVYEMNSLIQGHHGASKSALQGFVGNDANLPFSVSSLCPAALPSNVSCANTFCHSTAMLAKATPMGKLTYRWEDVLGKTGFLVFDGKVYNLNLYLQRDKGFLGADVNNALQKVAGKDASREIMENPILSNVIGCLDQLYFVGMIDVLEPGCVASRLVIIISTVILFIIVVTKFISAVVFNWFISNSLGKISRTKIPKSNVVMLVTCYSEGTESLKTTFDSLVATDYDNRKKLLFVIADGNVMGSGNAKSTPELCKDLMEYEPWSTDPVPQAYCSIAEGPKQINMAKVYAGWYEHAGNRVPMIFVEKCGGPSEANGPKAGNRGKRDSQILLMQFFSTVTFNERMTPLDYELFWKIQKLTGLYAIDYDIVAMVDADTLVKRDSIKRMVFSMERDPKVMGLCGETKIANKRTNWVTKIQVYEYYISHHLGKSFESIFGGVTCLPGCFCMYRFKVRNKDGTIVPILANPDIVQSYSENKIETLHKKNLLLLGEDRYLTTLMLRAFPKRKLIFVPNAVCKTVVPDEFKVLLSQRRRWINSTIHNLMELVFVRELCGIFCCSMQFVVVLELIGTVVLPISFLLLIFLIFYTIVQRSVENALSLLFFVATIFSQAFLVIFTKRKLSYVGWMFVFIAGMVIWNFVLPLYAFWHFDDVSWGATRKIHGPDTGHGDGTHDESFQNKITKKYWIDYEQERIQKESANKEILTTSTHPSQFQMRYNLSNHGYNINHPQPLSQSFNPRRESVSNRRSSMDRLINTPSNQRKPNKY